MPGGREMRVKNTLIYGLIISALLLSWVSVAGAWTYEIRNYAYTGSPALTGTVPGKTYFPKVAVISNYTNVSEQITVDLYYGHLSGNYEYSPNGGVNWITIANDVEVWSRTLSAGETIWLRVVVRNDDGNIYHILSPSPWGEADLSYEEDYYFAFPPAAHYYVQGGAREIGGYVAVVRP